ncbi:MAG: hypothetical protein WD424_02820 [Paenibacillaceae bacterium]
MSTFIGIAIIVFTCLVALWIVRIAGKGVREFDESKHESFLGK